MSGWIYLDYYCPCGRQIESLEKRSDVPPAVKCDVCGEWAERGLSTPAIKPCYASFTTGKSDPPPNALVCDTRPIADGKMTRKQWKAHRAKQWSDHDRKIWKDRTG